jgi:hypothetical protein
LRTAITPEFAIRDIALFERDVAFTAPFRFGAVTVEQAPQAFVRVEIELARGGRAEGAAAEMTIPKWFDKRPKRTPAQTIDDLRRSLILARGIYLRAGAFDTAFGHHATNLEAQKQACARENMPALAALYGPAQLDKAILDAVLRAMGMDIFTGLGSNIMGLDGSLTPDVSRNDVERFLQSRTPLNAVQVRHTVGMCDEIAGHNGLGAVAANTGCRYYKLKLGGDVEEDCRRLAAIGAELERVPFDTKVTLDANEQYASVESLRDCLTRIRQSAALKPICTRLLYVEQPFPREITFDHELSDVPDFPFIIDEADASYGAFPRAAALGYSGVSSKSCKGIYKSILNGVRAACWNETAGKRYFLAAEDLTCQAGLAVQQDTALAAFLRIPHAERNGHHYGRGFGGAPPPEAEAFLKAHPDFYRRSAEHIGLAIHDGALSTASLACPGFASAVHPRWDSLLPLEDPAHTSKETTP